MKILFTVLHIIVTVLLIVIVLAQEGKDPGMRGISGAAPDSGDSFFNRNGGGTKKSVMSKVTVALSILFLITTMTLVMIGG